MTCHLLESFMTGLGYGAGIILVLGGLGIFVGSIVGFFMWLDYKKGPKP